MARLSIIVPVYNVEQYLKRCVDSILLQTFTDLEIILVDDGSPDNCPAICDDYAEKYGHIHVIHQKNGGLSAARNAGIDWAISNSDSKWIGFVDGDDWLHPDMYKYLICAAENSGLKISVCDFMEASEQIQFPEYKKCVWHVENGLEFFLSDKRVAAVVAWNKIYGKALFQSIRYPVGKIHEDEYVTYRLLAEAGDVAFVNQPLYYYYQRADSIVHRKYYLRRLDAVEAIECQNAFFQEAGLDEYRIKSDVRLLETYVSHIYGLRSIHAKKECKRMTRKAKKLLGRVKKETEYTVAGHGREYYCLRPRYTQLVRFKANFSELIRSNGLKGTILYYIRRHFV